MEGRPRILMLAPETGLLSRRIRQEAGTLARLGAAVDILPTIEALPAPAEPAPGVRLLTPAHATAASGRAEGAARGLKTRIKAAAPGLHRLLDAAQYTLTDRAGQMAALNLDQALSLGPYDVVVAHDIPVLPLGVRLRDRWGAVLVVDLHELFADQADVLGSPQAQRYWRRVEAEGLGHADAILCVNEAIADYVGERYGLISTTVVHNAVPYVPPTPRGSALRDAYGIPAGRRVAVFGGSLRRHGSLDTLVQGFAEADLDGWVLAFLGSGPVQAELQALVPRLGLGGRVFIGHRAPQEDVVSVLASADFGIIPFMPFSRNLEISTPAKLYEYVQARLPILATPLPLVAPILERLGTGAFFDASSPSAVAEGLRAFVSVVLPAIDERRLESAARSLSWEAEEPALAAAVDRATGQRFGFAQRLLTEKRA